MCFRPRAFALTLAYFMYSLTLFNSLWLQSTCRVGNSHFWKPWYMRKGCTMFLKNWKMGYNYQDATLRRFFMQNRQKTMIFKCNFMMTSSKIRNLWDFQTIIFVFIFGPTLQVKSIKSFEGIFFKLEGIDFGFKIQKKVKIGQKTMFGTLWRA